MAAYEARPNGMSRGLRRAVLAALLLPAFALVPPAEAVGFGQNVEWVGTIPLTNDSAGARRLGDYFYITTSTALRIYDIRDPLNPVQKGFLQYTQTPQFAQEDVDTNGKILLIDDSVIDVSDKANPRVLSTHGVSSHTITCVLDCTWAYGSEGQIVDLRDPANPRTSTSRWPAPGNTHDVTEVAPGLIMSSSDPLLFLDARQDPEHPVLIGRGPNRNRFTHGNLWPQQGQDKFLLVGGESGASVGCSNVSAQFVTLDATVGWPTYDEAGNLVKLGEYSVIDEYRVRQGTYTDGHAAVNQWCTHWFETHSSYKDGGLVAMAWYEHGVRMLDIKPDGQIEEVGWYVPVAGMTSGVYWISDRIMYATDYQRSIDILRYTGPLPPA
ncbi:MAG: LVIVD repeat-containing protein [Actinomycetota bacterium]